jgi:hypothetical protein
MSNFSRSLATAFFGIATVSATAAPEHYDVDATYFASRVLDCLDEVTIIKKEFPGSFISSAKVEDLGGDRIGRIYEVHFVHPVPAEFPHYEPTDFLKITHSDDPEITKGKSFLAIKCEIIKAPKKDP